VVTVGGELRIEALELGYSPMSALYRAPLQAVANGGVLVIDDFGRQRASPREMLNRWIVPLESRVDHLVLQTGQKFELPFETLVVFATNLNPLDLLDGRSCAASATRSTPTRPRGRSSRKSSRCAARIRGWRSIRRWSPR
jgi:predicted ATPase with chaperone activity